MGAEEKKQTDPQEAAGTLLEKYCSGTLVLYAPITGGGKEITELPYDFMALTGWELAEAMDGDRGATNTFKLSSKQALLVFAAAAAKKTPELDAIDIKQRIGAADSIHAGRLASVFYQASALILKQTT